LFLHIDQAFGEILGKDQKMHQVLPYPFLWLQHHKFFTDAVKNVLPILAIFDSELIFGKVQWLH